MIIVTIIVAVLYFLFGFAAMSYCVLWLEEKDSVKISNRQVPIFLVGVSIWPVMLFSVSIVLGVKWLSKKVWKDGFTISKNDYWT
jgi:hypothetical protein